MSRVVWKYPLVPMDGVQNLLLQKDCEVISAIADENGMFMLYVLVDPTNYETRSHQILTSWDSAETQLDISKDQFIGTVIIDNRVYHVFDLGET